MKLSGGEVGYIFMKKRPLGLMWISIIAIITGSLTVFSSFYRIFSEDNNIMPVPILMSILIITVSLLKVITGLAILKAKSWGWYLANFWITFNIISGLAGVCSNLYENIKYQYYNHIDVGRIGYSIIFIFFLLSVTKYLVGENILNYFELEIKIKKHIAIQIINIVITIAIILVSYYK